MSDTQFSKEQFSSIYPPGIERYYWNHAKNLVVADALSRLKPKSILEVGAGAGIVTSFLKSKRFNIWGVELANMPDEFINKNLEGIFFTGKSIEQVPEEIRQKIDTILLLDVIEHIKNPQDIISSAVKSLPSLKNIVVTVPARREIWSNYDTFNGHFIRYDRPSLIEVFNMAGFNSTFCGYYFHALYWPALLLSLLGMKRNTNLLAPKRSQEFMHAILARLFYWEYKILPRWLVGSSIIAIFQK